MTPEQRAAELLPCKYITVGFSYMCSPEWDKSLWCEACRYRPQVAAALAEKDKETEYHKALYKQEHELALAQADIVIEANTEENKLQAEAAALRQRVAELEAVIAKCEDRDDVIDAKHAFELNEKVQAARVEGLRKIRGILEGKGNQTGEIFRSKAFFDAVDVIDAEIAALEGVK